MHVKNMNNKTAAVILAAGKGTRMKSSLPKVLSRVAGKTLVAHAIDSVLPLSPDTIIAVVGADMDNVAQEVKSRAQQAETVIQDPQLGTGDAVKQAYPVLDGFDGTVLILYGDTPFIKTDTLKRMVENVSQKSAVVTVLGFTPADSAQYGRLVVENDELQAIVEYKEATEEQRAIDLCNSGVMAVRGDLLPELLGKIDNNNAKGEYYLTDIVGIARAQGHSCQVVECDEREVMGINSQSDRARAGDIAQAELRERAMERGVVMIAPDTVYMYDDTEIAAEAVIHPYVVFGAGVRVAGGAEIKSFSHIEQAEIGEGAVVGPYARLRPGSEIGERAKIGNFVEVKKSVVKAGAKVSHLSYIGDSIVGEEANIGAGTITCNYDGYNKFTTEIGKGAFIGSNSSLIAPVKIGDGAIVGAGSTIMKDVEPDAIAINQMPQNNKEGRAKNFRDSKEN